MNFADIVVRLYNVNISLYFLLVVYLRSSPEIVHKRMLQRCRSEEMAVPLEYLKQVINLLYFFFFVKYIYMKILLIVPGS